jgi:hypothetical protein
MSDSRINILKMMREGAIWLWMALTFLQPGCRPHLSYRYDDSPSHSFAHLATPTFNSPHRLRRLGHRRRQLGIRLGPQDDDESIAAIHRALDLGINWIDTAAIYGLGHSEEVVGRAVKSRSGAKPLVFTKCSMRWHSGPLHLPLAQGRLAGRGAGRLAAPARRRDHRPLPDSLAQSRSRDRRGLGALAKFQSRARSAGSASPIFQRRADEARPEDCAHHQPAAALLHAAPGDRGGDSALCAGQRHRRHQLLAHGFRPVDRRHDCGAASRPSRPTIGAQAVEFKEPRLSRESAPGGAAARDRQRPRREPGVVAVAWTLHHPAITGAIVGGRSGKAGGRTGAGAHLPAERGGIRRINAFLSKLNPPRLWPRRNTAIMAKQQTPAEAGVSPIEKAKLHCCDEVGNHDGAFSCSNLGHACGHAGVHGGGAECVDTRTPSPAFENPYWARAIRTQTRICMASLRRVSSKQAIDCVAVLRGVVSHLHHGAGILVHDPQTLGSFHALPGIFGVALSPSFQRN